MHVPPSLEAVREVALAQPLTLEATPLLCNLALASTASTISPTKSLLTTGPLDLGKQVSCPMQA